MSKPATYVNGRGETICTNCVKLVRSGYCDCNRHGKKGNLQVELGDPLPVIGEEYDIDFKNGSGRSLRIEVTKIRSVNWWMRPGKTPGIEVKIMYNIVDVLEEGYPRPKLTLIK